MKLSKLINIFIFVSQFLVAQDEWKIFDSTNSPLQSNQIRVVETDSYGNIWLGTNNGLFKYDGVFWNNYNTYNSQIPYDQIDNFYLDRNDNIWFMVNASTYPYFIKFDGETWVTLDSSQTCFLDNSRLGRNFVVDGNGTKWINTNSNMIRYDSFSCNYYDLQSVGILTTDCNKIDVDNNDNFFFISQSYSFSPAGIARTSTNGWLYNYLSSYGYTIDFCIDEPNNFVWVSTFNTSTTKGNLVKLSYNSLQVLNSYDIYNPSGQGLKFSGPIVTDLNKNVWQSYWEAMGGHIPLGLLSFLAETGNWVLYDTTNSSLPSNNIQAIEVDLHNDKLIVTDKGLAMFNEIGINFSTQLTENDTLNFGICEIGTINSMNLTINNIFNYVLILDSVEVYSNNFSFDDSFPITLFPGDSSSVVLNFEPDLECSYSGKIVLYTNSGMYVEVLIGKGSLLNYVENEKTISEYNLGNNYPNPFNPSTTIEYQIPQSSFVLIKVYDALGNEVVTLINEEKPAGIHEVNFEPKDLTSGLYIYKIKAGNFEQTRKMLFLK